MDKDYFTVTDLLYKTLAPSRTVTKCLPDFTAFLPITLTSPSIKTTRVLLLLVTVIEPTPVVTFSEIVVGFAGIAGLGVGFVVGVGVGVGFGVGVGVAVGVGVGDAEGFGVGVGVAAGVAAAATVTWVCTILERPYRPDAAWVPVIVVVPTLTPVATPSLIVRIEGSTEVKLHAPFELEVGGRIAFFSATPIEIGAQVPRVGTRPFTWTVNVVVPLFQNESALCVAVIVAMPAPTIVAVPALIEMT